PRPTESVAPPAQYDLPQLTVGLMLQSSTAPPVIVRAAGQSSHGSQDTEINGIVWSRTPRGAAVVVAERRLIVMGPSGDTEVLVPCSSKKTMRACGSADMRSTGQARKGRISRVASIRFRH